MKKISNLVMSLVLVLPILFFGSEVYGQGVFKRSCDRPNCTSNTRSSNDCKRYRQPGGLNTQLNGSIFTALESPNLVSSNSFQSGQTAGNGNRNPQEVTGKESRSPRISRNGNRSQNKPLTTEQLLKSLAVKGNAKGKIEINLDTGQLSDEDLHEYANGVTQKHFKSLGNDDLEPPSEFEIREAIAIFEKLNKRNESNYHSLLMTLGGKYYDAKQNRKSYLVHQQAERYIAKYSGKNNPQYLLVIRGLYHNEVVGNKWDRAEARLKEGLQITSNLSNEKLRDIAHRVFRLTPDYFQKKLKSLRDYRKKNGL